MNHFHGLGAANILRDVGNKLLTEGAMAEQFIGQHLLYSMPSYEEPRLYYWLREGKTANAEVDFIFAQDARITAVEVKAGAVGKIRSLHEWWRKITYSKKSALRFNLSSGAIEKVSQKIGDQLVEYDLITLPLYLVERARTLNY